MRAWIVAASLVLAAMAGRAHAQPADVPALIKLVETQPADMERSAWKEKRRDAAKKLAASKDKRAVPVLMKLAESETFDIIGEISIEGLGTLGDQSAVPTLQKIVADTSRDKSQRDLAKKALAKLGAAAEVPPDKGAGSGSGGGTGLETSAGGGGSGSATEGGGGGSAVVTGGGGTGSHILDTGTGVGTKAPTELPAGPDFSDDTLAAYDRLTLAGGTASIGYDTARKRLDFEGNVAGLYNRRLERESTAFGLDAGATIVTGFINPPGRAQSRGVQIDANLDGEARFYTGPIYGIGKVATSLQIDYIADVDPMNANNDFRETTTQADLGIALGAGYGRVLDVGAAIRVRRLQRTLDAARALGKPIDAATSKKLQVAWWSLRGASSTYRALVATVAILREAGILLGEPDSGLAYEILNVLRDTNLYVRPSGFDINAVFAEDYLRRPEGLIAQNFENGRVEQLIASAGYGQQMSDDLVELAGTAFARIRLFAGDNGGNPNPSPWAVGATGHFTRFTYGDHGDPFGAFDLTGTVLLSTDDRMGTDKALMVAGELGFTMVINQASGLRLAAQVAQDQNTIVIGAVLKATYGLLDGTFAK